MGMQCPHFSEVDPMLTFTLSCESDLFPVFGRQEEENLVFACENPIDFHRREPFVCLVQSAWFSWAKGPRGSASSLLTGGIIYGCMAMCMSRVCVCVW